MTTEAVQAHVTKKYMAAVGMASQTLQMRHYRCNLCYARTAGELPSSEQADLYGIPGHREGV